MDINVLLGEVPGNAIVTASESLIIIIYVNYALHICLWL